MTNSLGRNVPEGKKPFVSSTDYKSHKRQQIGLKTQAEKPVFYESLETAFVDLSLHSGMTFSFHHHLRSGDKVLNQIAKLIEYSDLNTVL